MFWSALRNTAIWVGVTVVLELGLGLAAAIALDMELGCSRAIAVVVLLPWFLPVVVAGNIWALMLDSGSA